MFSPHSLHDAGSCLVACLPRVGASQSLEGSFNFRLTQTSYDKGRLEVIGHRLEGWCPVTREWGHGKEPHDFNGLWPRGFGLHTETHEPLPANYTNPLSSFWGSIIPVRKWNCLKHEHGIFIMIHVSLSKRPTELESVSVYSSLFAMVGKFNIKYLN